VGTGDRCGLSPHTSVGPPPADGSYLNYRRLPWPMEVIIVTSTGLPPTDGNLDNFRRLALANENYLIFICFFLELTKIIWTDERFCFSCSGRAGAALGTITWSVGDAIWNASMDTTTVSTATTTAFVDGMIIALGVCNQIELYQELEID
jgi:hypothetical protein